ncbi:hypothetical protein [Pseudooceanicola sp. MF1-13]|uniref:hypothetical protein n=1 Tax=Pseudooceanicola sp. MF1-13 TaxID=3379095 RepID=UPI0038921B57
MAETIHELSASSGRRVFGVGVLSFLGLLLLRMGLMGGGPGLLDLVVLAMGVIALVAAWIMYRATMRSIILTEEALVDSEGVVLARLDDILTVDRGTFAFKPSNGFLIRTTKGGPRLWQPGLYWRFGRRIGVGGITRAAEAKLMADLITVKLAERAAEEAGA